MKKEWVVKVDEREKQPLPLPERLSVLDRSHLPTLKRTRSVRILTKSTRLLTGDYQLEGFEHRVIVERKKNLREIANNCLAHRGRARFIDELQRLRNECSRPLLFFEDVPDSRPNPDASAARDALLDLLLKYRVGWCMMPARTLRQRQVAGEWVTAMLIAGASDGAETFAGPGDPSAVEPAG